MASPTQYVVGSEIDVLCRKPNWSGVSRYAGGIPAGVYFGTDVWVRAHGTSNGLNNPAKLFINEFEVWYHGLVIGGNGVVYGGISSGLFYVPANTRIRTENLGELMVIATFQ